MPRGRIRKFFIPAEELRKLYIDELWSSYDLASHFGCSTPTIFAAMIEHGIQPRKVGNAVRGKPKRFNLPSEELRRSYVEKQQSVEAIARRYECSAPTVRASLLEIGVTIRACNDTKRGAPSPLRTVLHVSDDEVVALYLEKNNRSVSEVARLLGCHASIIKRILSQKGISTKSPSQVIAGKRLGRDNPNWRDDLTDEERTRRRDNAKTVRWRLAVYERDRFTCLKCGDDTGGNLNAHHIESYNRNRGLRWQVDNGATLCECCHRLFHKTFGYGDNTAAQFAAFLRQCVGA